MESIAGELPMSERELFRAVAQHFAMGAVLGALFMAILLAIQVHRISDVALHSSNPVVPTTVLIIGAALYFAFGAAVTGFHFVITAEGDQGRGRR
jgi:hypothetical protein